MCQMHVLRLVGRGGSTDRFFQREAVRFSGIEKPPEAALILDAFSLSREVEGSRLSHRVFPIHLARYDRFLLLFSGQ